MGIDLKKVAELVAMKDLMTRVTPTGILSYVADGIDFWAVITEILPRLKDTIMARDGTVVIRPDSGDPVKILTGYTVDEYTVTDTGMILDNETGKALAPYEIKGLMECLLETFGGAEVETSKGTMRILDSHIGAIYGDSITLERQDQIINRLEAKAIVPTVVLGIGSYTYQYVTRDTHGSAVKATDTQRGEGNHVPIFKDPKTDSKKKSAKGLLAVGKRDGEYVLLDDVTPEVEASSINELKTVFVDGVMVEFHYLDEIRNRMNDELKGYNK